MHQGNHNVAEQAIVQFPDIYFNPKELITNFRLCYLVSRRIALCHKQINRKLDIMVILECEKGDSRLDPHSCNLLSQEL